MNKLRLILYVAFKTLLAAAILLSAVLFNKFLLFPGLQAVFGFDENTGSYIKVLGSLVTMALAYWAFVKFYEKRAVTELGFHSRRARRGYGRNQ